MTARLTPYLTPYLTMKDASGAIEFYKKAFGAKEPGARITDADGRIGHAHVEIGSATLYIAEEHPEGGIFGPTTLGGTPVRLTLNVDDVDAVFERAVAEGAKVLIPVADQFYGERAGRLEDPHGHVWIITTTLETLSDDEMRERTGDDWKLTSPPDA